MPGAAAPGKYPVNAHGAAWACNQNRTGNEETEKQKQVCSEKAATERVCTAFYK